MTFDESIREIVHILFGADATWHRDGRTVYVRSPATLDQIDIAFKLDLADEDDDE